MTNKEQARELIEATLQTIGPALASPEAITSLLACAIQSALLQMPADQVVEYLRDVADAIERRAVLPTVGTA